MAVILKNTVSSEAQKREYEDIMEKIRLLIDAQNKFLIQVESEYENICKGSTGELLIADELNKLPDDCFVINGISLLDNGKKVQFDHIIVTKKGYNR